MTIKLPRLGSHLEWHNGKIRVTIAVPRPLRAKLGCTRLKKSLKTDSPALAERIKHGVIHELKTRLNANLKAMQTTSLTSEAMDWRADIEAAQTDRDTEALQFLLHDRAKELEQKDGYQVARGFHDVASGLATPLDHMLETYISGSGLRDRSGDEARRAIRVLRGWCEAAKVPSTIEAINRKTAGRFVTEHLLVSLSRKTTEKYLSFLSGYWKFLIGKGYAEERVWSGQLDGVNRGKTKRAGIETLGVNGGTGKRPYTTEEARKLLYAEVSKDVTAQRTADLTWLGALSGMRLDEICRLRIADIRGGWFNVNTADDEGKTNAAKRRVPVHPALSAIIERRSKGKESTSYLIEDLPEPEPGSMRERSMPASKAYTRFRRDLGIDERKPGQRQSNVDFHSWRRWFIRESRDAGTAFWTLADLVGHDTASLPGGLTMGGYPGSASDAMLIAAVKCVQVPPPPSN